MPVSILSSSDDSMPPLPEKGDFAIIFSGWIMSNKIRRLQFAMIYCSGEGFRKSHFQGSINIVRFQLRYEPEISQAV